VTSSGISGAPGAGTTAMVHTVRERAQTNGRKQCIRLLRSRDLHLTFLTRKFNYVGPIGCFAAYNLLWEDVGHDVEKDGRLHTGAKEILKDPTCPFASCNRGPGGHTW
jgi:hypothetical protein